MIITTQLFSIFSHVSSTIHENAWISCVFWLKWSSADFLIDSFSVLKRNSVPIFPLKFIHYAYWLRSIFLEGKGNAFEIKHQESTQRIYKDKLASPQTWAYFHRMWVGLTFGSFRPLTFALPTFNKIKEKMLLSDPALFSLALHLFKLLYHLSCSLRILPAFEGILTVVFI